MKIHTTDNDIIDLTQQYPVEEDNFDAKFYKPYGLWYSIDYEWHEWVSSNMPGRIGKNNFDLEIDTDSLFIVDSKDKIFELFNSYGVSVFKMKNLISWENLRIDYKGFEITCQHKIHSYTRDTNHNDTESMDRFFKSYQ